MNGALCLSITGFYVTAQFRSIFFALVDKLRTKS